MSIYNYGNITINDGLSNGGFLIVYGSVACRLFSVSSTNTDHFWTQGNRLQGTTILDILVSLYGTFTGFHRCFTDDELYNNDDPNKFKDVYVGRIVISNGKIATDITKQMIKMDGIYFMIKMKSHQRMQFLWFNYHELKR